MDLLAAEIARKRKAKAEEFGGAKYVKRSQISAAREAKIREEEEAEARAKRSKISGGAQGLGSGGVRAVDVRRRDVQRRRARSIQGRRGGREGR